MLCHESGELSLSRLLVRPPWPLELCLSFTEVLRGRHSCLLSALLRARSGRGEAAWGDIPPPPAHPHPGQPSLSLPSSATGPGAALPGRHGTGELGFGPGAQLGQPVHAALPRGSLCGDQPGTRLLRGQLLRETHSHVVHTGAPRPPPRALGTLQQS